MCVCVSLVNVIPFCAAVARWTVFHSWIMMMTRRRKERGGMCVCVVMQRDWETRDMEKRDNEHNDEAGWIFFIIIFWGPFTNERLTLSLFYTQQTTFDYQYNNLHTYYIPTYTSHF